MNNSSFSFFRIIICLGRAGANFENCPCKSSWSWNIGHAIARLILLNVGDYLLIKLFRHFATIINKLRKFLCYLFISVGLQRH